jgi:hypothetical protein
VVWVKRWALDTRGEIDGAGMVDPRVTHLWDTGNVIGQGFLDRFGVTFGGLDYDFFLLFDRHATWGDRVPRSSARASGWPTVQRCCSAEDGLDQPRDRDRHRRHTRRHHRSVGGRRGPESAASAAAIEG